MKKIKIGLLIREFENLSSMDISIDQDLQYWLTTKESPSSLDSLPPLPPPIKSIDYNDILPENWSVYPCVLRGSALP